MQWASENLPKTYFYSSGDDDFTVDVGKLYEALENARKIVEEEGWPMYPILCTYRTVKSSEPYRNETGPYKKWFISHKEYMWPYYPRFCLGGFYTTSVDVISQLHEMARKERYLRVDDVWITGILRQKMGMPGGMIISPNATIAVHGVGKTPEEIQKFEKARLAELEKKLKQDFEGMSKIQESMKQWAVHLQKAQSRLT